MHGAQEHSIILQPSAEALLLHLEMGLSLHQPGHLHMWY